MNWLNYRDRIGALLMLVFSLGYLSQIDNIRLLPFLQGGAFTPRTLPYVLAGLGIILSLLLLFKKPPADDDGITHWKQLHLGQAFLLCLAMVIYGLTVRPLGFVFTTTLFLIAGFIIMGERNWKILLGASLPIAFSFWYLMDQVLNISIQAMPAFLGGGG